MASDLTKFKVLSFDIYGTLIDWESGIFEALLPLLSKLSEENPRHPNKNTTEENRKFLLSAYTKLELEVQQEHPTFPYPKILAAVYERLASQFSLPFNESEATAFGSTIGEWPAFPDTVAAMQVLGSHYKLVVLSNVDRASFARTNSGPLNGVKFDAIYTAEDIGSYKPDLRNFQYLVDHAEKDFGAKKDEILKVAQSLQHDHVAAKKFGLQPSIWIKRAGDNSRMGGTYQDYKDEVQLAGAYDTLGDFAEAVKTAFGEGA